MKRRTLNTRYRSNYLSSPSESGVETVLDGVVSKTETSNTMKVIER